jgi:hypothetical protein
MIIKVPISNSDEVIYINSNSIVYIYPKKTGGCDIYLDKTAVNNSVFSCNFDASYIVQLINNQSELLKVEEGDLSQDDELTA